ncbi:pilus assembly protein TadG [Neorhizobium sp. SOG26]|uniref:TadE/TadG family type IV pilus assembly protein n=1 Tax=Neorhizobium sp. SOG26 TaxID=2060726 RepID=UPI000E594DD5|nr:TadE/TadG family type IV pilus assembly protein [Neorhizobium sp. SOG26]AXV16196.1 pilus assembly protein TadG [Neorhizobium sp. SOG26]
MQSIQFNRLLKDRSGNFGIITAVMLPVMLGLAGIAVDVSHALDQKSRIQALADAATLAVASAMADKGNMSEQEAAALGLKTFISQTLASDGSLTPEQRAEEEKKLRDATTFQTTSTSSNNSDSYDVLMKSTYEIPMNGMSAVVGFKTLKVTVESRASSGREGNALSMYLVLDESGSMAWDTTTIDPVAPSKKVKKQRKEKYPCPDNEAIMCERLVEEYVDAPNYIVKMASLKTAAGVMFDELKKADPNSGLIRVGASSYDDKTKSEQKIEWGTSEVSKYVTKLPAKPDGGTDASGALTNAYAALKAENTREKNAHDAKKNKSFERFIVFMTDGEMTGNGGIWSKKIHDQVMGICEQAKNDKDAGGNPIKIYTIAFMAPAKGKELLEACSSGKEFYYEPNNMTQLVQTFGEIARKAAKTGTRLTN